MMNERIQSPVPPDEPAWVSALVRTTPSMPLMAPYMVYLLFMTLNDVLPPPWLAIGWVLRAAAAGWTAWVFRHHLPPFGKPHLLLGIVVGLFTAWMWVAGQHGFDAIGLGKTLSPTSLFSSSPHLFTDPVAAVSPRAQIPGDGAWYAHVVIKLGYSATIVPLVEELFWRAFLLRAFISWNHWDDLPLGTFAWRSFLGTALLSTLQHPSNWGVSILCWLLFNALFCWKRSLWLLIITHGVTNLTLYSYVVKTGDWRFW